MAEHIAVDQDLIIAHAARVRQVAADVAVARDAASATNMSGGAFGVMCAFLVAPASLVAQVTGATITAAERLVERSATEIRGVADDMAAFEQDVVDALRGLEGQVGR
ncbi:hypothetical protein [Microbacterium terrisoli]|uniref:hypothetical protein n=1 Tax=Microbacterium terrisoli TaxID=3242192 RepID=UPI00280591EF|nr:hypothetical protein [Microbacterium protaetiae]